MWINFRKFPLANQICLHSFWWLEQPLRRAGRWQNTIQWSSSLALVQKWRHPRQSTRKWLCDRTQCLWNQHSRTCQLSPLVWSHCGYQTKNHQRHREVHRKHRNPKPKRKLRRDNLYRIRRVQPWPKQLFQCRMKENPRLQLLCWWQLGSHT